MFLGSLIINQQACFWTFLVRSIEKLTYLHHNFFNSTSVEVLYRKCVDSPANHSLFRYPQQATNYNLHGVSDPFYICEPVNQSLTAD